MSAEEPKESTIKNLFSSLLKLKKDHPWISLWTIRFLQYFVLFCFVIIPGIMIFRQFNLVPTGLENARYFLSAMVQTQAAIVSLVITLTLIAIQMAAASYTPRVIDVIKKNPDMWLLLIIYLVSISYGFIVLKLVAPDPDPVLVSSVLILGMYTFSILFLYMWNTIALLRPDKIVTMLVGEINTKNIHQEKWKDDIMQPVFDVVHASISRFDVTTTRTGLNTLSNRILELFTAFDDKSNRDIANHFCDHIQRSALVALRNDDEGVLLEIIDILKNFDIWCVEPLQFIGVHAADKGLAATTGKVANILEEVGIQAADKGLEGATIGVADALWEIGIQAVDKGLVDKGLIDVSNPVVHALREVGVHAADKGLAATSGVVYALREIGIQAADKGLKNSPWRVAWALRKVGTHAAEMELNDDVDHVVMGLCRIGCKEVGRDAAVRSLAPFLFCDRDRMTKVIDDFKSKLDPKEGVEFKHFMDKVNEELKILESSL